MQSMSSLFSLENGLPSEGGGYEIERTKNDLLGAPSYTPHHWELGVQLCHSIIFTNVSGVLRPGGKKSMIDTPYLYGANIKGRGAREKARCEGSVNTRGNQRMEPSKGETWE